MAAVAWPVVLVLYSLLLTAVVVVAKDDNETNDNTVKLKVDIRKETLVGAPSCQHTFTQIELLNLVSCRSTIKMAYVIFALATGVFKELIFSRHSIWGIPKMLDFERLVVVIR